MTNDPRDFIQKIWNMQRTDGKAWGFTSKKDWETGEWSDYPTKKIRDVDLLNQRDNYFCPNLFSGGRRREELVLPSRWLYSDLDEVDPRTLERALRPSLAWETSPGRFQALWLLDRPLRASRHRRLNQRLTYAIGADKGGWGLTKVLRVPGTVSTKYGRSRDKRFTVKLVAKGGPHRVEALMETLPHLSAGRKSGVRQLFGSKPDELPDYDEVIQKWRKSFPARAKRLLATKALVASDDRSGRLWDLYSMLLQAGLPAPAVLVVVKRSVWNKFKGRHNELGELQRDLMRAIENHAHRDEKDRLEGAAKTLREAGTIGSKPPSARVNEPKGRLAKQAKERSEANEKILPYMRLPEFMATQFPKPEWLVDGVWAKGAYGVCAGMYKSYKTWVLLNLTLTVASGTAFLEDDRFKAHEKGRVLYLHEEGRQGGIQDRLHRMMMRKDLGPKVRGTTIIAPKNLPIDISSRPGFKLSDTFSQEKLVNYIIKRKPKLIIMESWYLIASDVNENNAADVAPVLDWLAKISQEFGCAIIVSHHYNKSQDEEGSTKRRAVDRISGSGVFGRWYESVILLERKGSEDDYQATIEAHHREQKGIARQTLKIEIDGEDEDDFAISFVDNDSEGVGGSKPKKLSIRGQALLDNIEERITGKQFLKLSSTARALGTTTGRLFAIAEAGGYKVVQRKAGESNKEIWVITK